MQKKYMAGPQVCPDFSAQPIGFESACTPFLTFFIAIILRFGLLIFEILNEKCFSNSKSSTKQAKTFMKVNKTQRIIEKIRIGYVLKSADVGTLFSSRYF